MIRINPQDLGNSYFVTLGNVCRISPQEARAILSDFEAGRVSPRNPQIEALVIRDMRSILDAYSYGKIVYLRNGSLLAGDTEHPHMEGSTNPLEIRSDEPDDSKLKKEELVYLETSEMPAPLRIPSDKEFVPISEMNLESLLIEEPIGRINPPMPGVNFVCSRLQIPVTSGFIKGLTYKGDYLLNPFVDLERSCTSHQFTVDYPNILKNRIIPVPLGAELSSIEPKVKVALPGENSPVIWVCEQELSNLRYTIQQVSNDSLVLRANRELFLPTKEEQRYWQCALPLPESYKKSMSESKEDLLNLIASYLAKKEATSRLSNFRYICNQRFGKFILDNSKDLPLIMSELKVGHCDLLAWYVAAQLRAGGEAAWVAGNLITTKDGKAFNASYQHATVVVVKKDRRLAFYDPTVHCDFDKAYHSAVLKDEMIDELERRFKSAESIREKVRILREFNLEIERLRPQAEVNEEVINDMKKLLEEGSISTLFSTTNHTACDTKFDDSKLRVQNKIADWDYLPASVTPETIDVVNKMLMAGDFFDPEKPINQINSCFPIVNDGKTSQAIKEQIIWLLRAYHKKKLFAYFGSSYGLNPNLFDSKSSLTSTDLKELYPALGIKVAECPAQFVIERSTTQDLLTYLTSDYFRRAGIFTSEYLDEENLLALETDERSEFRDYKYSDYFIKCLQEGSFPYMFTSIRKIINFDTSSLLEKGEHLSPTINQQCDLRNNLIYFAFEYQHACVDKNYRAHLINKLGISEQTFKNLARFFVGIHEERFRNTQKLPAPLFEDMDYLKSFYSLFYLDGNCEARFASSVRALLQRMDSSPSKGHTIEHDELREYTIGDDLRGLDWKYFARSNRLFVKQSPRSALGISTPLHVLLDDIGGLAGDSNSIVYPLQVRELIRVLQKDSRVSGREIFIGIKNRSSYYKLPLNVRPVDVLACIAFTPNCYYRGPMLSSGRLPKNLLFVTDTFRNAVSMKYLYGSHCNLETLYLQDKPYRVYPLPNEENIKKTFSKD